ncbi:ATP/cobalamin adenosyltransferase [Caldalkalibacillus thermarum TA2.A1]|uniref:Corrinoid adenosyltransferase n=2 Tax=Caldalkalibacillus TaxID=379065 RepID=F5LAV4_CALTT|nr:cob(I)yrinic acid a,c-diamide adenosyltransferase [Caldalkalibacillus thermarum]EGL81493.1 ATP/cobalamin adenosyltransferase [Caldalkalibacillus thermarum TA2.A1]QZT33796.1 cob(I)yrinic acid a,c-diamide adenosyltransferase [Caldalkalibacillus thermarum TA2.A1]
MKIYTRTGDEGQTSIVGGRVSKASEKVEAYGTVDEANSFVGVAIAHLPEEEHEIRAELEKIQHELFDCGSDLSKKEGAERKYPYKVTEEMVTFLEKRIDAYVEEAPDLERFILPGGTKAAAYLHVARTVVRRAERQTVRLAEKEQINPNVQKYLNRLSDYFFALARVINHRAGHKDVEYVRSANVFSRRRNKEKGND